MKKWLNSNRLYFIGAIAGGMAGFLYWKWVGCSSGTCSITASPINSTLYFSLMGAVVLGMLSTQKQTK